MKNIIFIFSIFFLTLTACELNTWNEENRDAFMEGCLEEGGEEYREYCECALKEVMMEYKPLDAPFISDEEWDEIGSACYQYL